MFTCLGSVVFLVPPGATRYLKPAQRKKVVDPSVAESACHAMLLGHSVEDGLHHRRGDRDAFLANTVALLSQNGNDRIDSVWRFAAFLLALVQPSSQCPHREPRSEDIRQPCRQVVRDHPVVPSLQVAQQCVVHHPEPQIS